MKNVTLFIFIFFTIFLLYQVIASRQTPSEKNTQPISTSVVVDKNLTIAAAGDVACSSTSGKNECYQKQTADLIINYKPDIVLALGDLQYESGIYKYFFSFYEKTWGQFKNITKPVPGNHEYNTTDAKGYFDYFNGVDVTGGQAGERGKGYYSFDIGNWHVVALNSNCWAIKGCDESSEQYQWLEKDLRKNNKVCTIAYWHHPVFSSGLHGNDTSMKSIWKLLYDHQTETVLSGHDHLYERFEKQDASGMKDAAKGIQEFVVGTGGRSLYAIKEVQKNSVIRETSTYGVLFLTFQKDAYEWEFVSVDNDVMDAGTGTCF